MRRFQAATSIEGSTATSAFIGPAWRLNAGTWPRMPGYALISAASAI